MRKLKVMTIVGTRPEIVKLSRVIAELDRQAEHLLVHSGQNYDYELNEVFFQEMGIHRPDHFLEAVRPTAAETIGQVIAATDGLLEQTRPDAVLFYGDTNTCLAAIAAKRRKIPVFHMEAGNRCFDQRVPEEINRKIIDHISDINMPLTEHARRYLLDEGLRPETVIKIGSTMGEVLAHYRPQIEKSEVLHRLGLEPGDYFVASAHREENVDSELQLERLLGCFNAIAAQYRRPIVVSLHPRTRIRMQSRAEGWDLDPLIQFCKPFGFFDYIMLQKNARCVLSDSGTLTEEASLLDFPAVMLRETHERPEGMDVGTLVMSGLRIERVLQAIEMVTSQRLDSAAVAVPLDYQVECVSKKVARIILSYVDYVIRTVWSKPPREDAESVNSSRMMHTAASRPS